MYNIIPLPNQQLQNKSASNEIHVDENFTYDGYQVVRREFFAHLFEPSITLSREKIAVNSACLRKLPDVSFVQFLVNPEQKKLAVKPCNEDDKDSFRWASSETDPKKRKPKQITCHIFFAKIMSLMSWDPRYRYKILGTLIRTNAEILYIFDLQSAEVYKSKSKGGAKPIYPESWKDQFGLPVCEHDKALKIDVFDDYAVFRLEKTQEAACPSISKGEKINDAEHYSGSEEIQDSYS